MNPVVTTDLAKRGSIMRECALMDVTATTYAITCTSHAGQGPGAGHWVDSYLINRSSGTFELQTVIKGLSNGWTISDQGRCAPKVKATPQPLRSLELFFF